MSATTADVTIPDQAEMLVVEDDRDVVALYATWLNDTNAVRTVTDGAEALATIDEDVDVVLLDRKLPDCAGEEVLTTIHERDLGCQVVIVSGVEPDFDLVGMEFDAYLVKPVTKAEIRDAIRQALARASYDPERQEFYQLSKKRDLLDERKTAGERETSQAYAALETRLAELGHRLDDVPETVDGDLGEWKSTTADGEPDG